MDSISILYILYYEFVCKKKKTLLGCASFVYILANTTLDANYVTHPCSSVFLNGAMSLELLTFGRKNYFNTLLTDISICFRIDHINHKQYVFASHVMCVCQCVHHVCGLDKINKEKALEFSIG